jgi:hypothetical protein
MTSLQLTENAKKAFDSLALSYSNNGDIKEAIELASIFLETKTDASDFELALRLFLEEKLEATVEKKNDDGLIIKETVIFQKKKQWGGKRVGSGRKKGVKTKVVSFRVPVDFVDELRELVNKAIENWK